MSWYLRLLNFDNIPDGLFCLGYLTACSVSHLT